VLRDKEVWTLRNTLRATLGVELQCEVHFMERVGDNLILEYAILIDNTFEADSHSDKSKFS